MAILMEKDGGTANQRTVHFRLFTSNGTSPDTTASNDSVIVARGSTTTFTPNLLVTAVHSAQGMYSIQLSASDISNLGQHAVYHTQGDFPQHVAAIDVVNFNPYSTQSNILNISNLDATITSRSVFSSADSVGLKAQVHSGATVGINNIAAGTYSGVTVGSLATIVAGDYGSSITFGVSTIKAGTYSGVTVGSAATILGGGIVASSFGASAIDAAALATDAGQEIADRILLRNIAGGSDSGRTVGTALYVLRNKLDASSSVGTVYQTDDASSAWTFSITTAVSPIAVVDPT